MVKVWFKQMAGQHCTEMELVMIGHPRRELLTHVTVKNIQMLGLLGLTAVGPLTALARGHRSFDEIRQAALTAGKYGACAGLVTGPVLVGARMSMFTDAECFDRCYRLRHNKNVVNTDRLSFLGAALGSGVAVWLGASASDGAVTGMVGGILLAAAYNIAKAGTIIPDTSGM